MRIAALIFGIAIGSSSTLLVACGFPLSNLAAPSDDLHFYDGLDAAPADKGRIRFLFDDMSGLSTQTLATNAFPWKLVTAALLVAHQRNADVPISLAELGPLLQGFGFVTPSDIANWSGPFRQPRFTKPLGLVTGMLDDPASGFRLEVANVSCAMCHAGVTYGATGEPQKSVWLGQPNTSINIQAFVEEISQSLASTMREPTRLVSAIQTLYPDVDLRELATIRELVLPVVARRIAASRPGLPLHYPAGANGRTNGLGSIKFVLGLLPSGNAPDEKGLISIPDLAGVALRSALLVDNAYAPKDLDRYRTLRAGDVDQRRIDELANMSAVVTIPVMGVTPVYAVGNRARMKDVAAFLASIAPSPFPGPIDLPKAKRGAAVYRDKCATCHGSYSEGVEHVRLIKFPNRLIPIGRIGTDPVRLELTTPDVVTALQRSPFGSTIDFTSTGGYVAPRLSGVWASAPYLHNGSVPTLWQLMHPAQRPSIFEVGGHKLDFVEVGIAGYVDTGGTMRYPADYHPWAEPSFYDTTQVGQSNKGHEEPFAEMTDTEKWALLEYLKLL